MFSEYLDITHETCENLEKRGVLIEPYKSPTVFESLDKEAAQQAIHQAKKYRDWSMPLEKKPSYKIVSDFSQELRNNDLALDAALTCAFQGFEMDYKAFPKLVDEGDVVDAYTLDFRQIYCNENFFKNTSYTLDQLSSISIFDLFKRSSFVEAELKRSCLQAIQNKKPVALKTEKYLMHELRSEAGIWLEARHKYILPIFNAATDRPEGVLSIISVRKLDSDQFSDISII